MLRSYTGITTIRNGTTNERKKTMLNWIDIQQQEERRRDWLREAEQQRLIDVAKQATATRYRVAAFIPCLLPAMAALAAITINMASR